MLMTPPFLLKIKSLLCKFSILIFSKYSGLKINKSKCEIAGIGVKNGVKIALLGAKCIDLNTQHILQPFDISIIMLLFTVPPLASPLITIKFPPCLTFDHC